MVELLGPVQKGILGGKGSRDPARDKKVRFIAQEGSELYFNPDECISDKGGIVRTEIETGKILGDQYFDVVSVKNPQTRKTIRIINGVEISGCEQEGFTKSKLKKNIVLKLVNEKMLPIKDAAVYFNLAQTPEKLKNHAKIIPETVKTDENGKAECSLKLGDETGVYVVNAEIKDSNSGLSTRGIPIKQMGMNIYRLIFTVLGGLAIFIYGMHLMSSGLHLIAANKMKVLLEYFTANRFFAVLSGITLTGIIQSSSACSVMVVGFVNAGLLSLRQAIGVIFGANVGTTVTAQMISFKLGALAFPAIILGLIAIIFIKKPSWKAWGQAIMGFGLLFFGLGIMSHELKILKEFPSFVDFFKNFNCTPVNGTMPILPVLGAIAIGTFMTIIIQSSSATIGIAMALAAGGLINFYTAIPLILGDNIGTTITAILASIGTNKTARQTALAHFLFNFLGTLYMFALFFVHYPGTNQPIFLYIINSITAGNVLSEVPENITRNIAMAHSTFNIFNLLIFLPFTGLVAKLCQMIIKIKPREQIKFTILEPHLIKTPSAAIEQSILALREMCTESWNMIKASVNKSFLIEDIDDKLYEDILQREDNIDKMQLNVTDYLLKVTQQELTSEQTEIIPLIIHCANDAEKIADQAENVLKLTEKLKKTKKGLSKKAVEEINLVWKSLTEEAEKIIDSVHKTDKDYLIQVMQEKKKIHKLTRKFEKKQFKRVKKGKYNTANGIIILEILMLLERIADHFVNIADRMPEIQHHHLTIKRKKSSTDTRQNTLPEKDIESEHIQNSS